MLTIDPFGVPHVPQELPILNQQEPTNARKKEIAGIRDRPKPLTTALHSHVKCVVKSAGQELVYTAIELRINDYDDDLFILILWENSTSSSDFDGHQ